MKFIPRSFSKIGDFDFINLDYVQCQYELVQAHHVPAHIVYLHYARISMQYILGLQWKNLEFEVPMHTFAFCAVLWANQGNHSSISRERGEGRTIQLLFGQRPTHHHDGVLNQLLGKSVGSCSCNNHILLCNKPKFWHTILKEIRWYVTISNK